MEQLTDTIMNEHHHLFNLEIINPEDFTRLLVRFALNLLVIFIVVHFIYFKNSNRKDFYFSYFAISITIFTLCFLLESVNFEIGFAIGLFAIFGIIRYRTDPIPIKEMTYLFVIIGISVINGLSNKNVIHGELLFTNFIIVVTMGILEKIHLFKQEICLILTYENVKDIHILKKEELINDIQERTGVDVKRIEIKEINYRRKYAVIWVFHDKKGKEGKSNIF